MNSDKAYKVMLGLLMCIAVAGCGVQKQEAASTTWYVSNNVSGESDGLSWDSAFTHPQDAVDSAQTGDRIWVSQGTYSLRESGDEILLRLKEGVAVLGGFTGTEVWEMQRIPRMFTTVLDGGSLAYHVVNGANGALLDGFTITGGNADGVHENSAGGGMINLSSSPTIENCVFLDNSALVKGGGIFNEEGSPTLVDCVFQGNTAQYGGAIENYRASPTVINTVFLENRSAQNGGAVSNYFGSPEFINCTFSGNRTTFSGGAVFNYNGTGTFTNCTFTGNRSEQKGGAIGSLNSELRLTNCILWRNISPEQSEISAYGSDAKINYSNVEGGFHGTGNDDCCPAFVKDGSWDGESWVEGDYRLTERSPCVDSGTDVKAPDFDIEWEPRPQAQSHDMGAYEYRP